MLGEQANQPERESVMAVKRSQYISKEMYSPTPREVFEAKTEYQLLELCRRSAAYEDETNVAELEDALISGNAEFLASYDRYCEGR